MCPWLSFWMGWPKHDQLILLYHRTTIDAIDCHLDIRLSNILTTALFWSSVSIVHCCSSLCLSSISICETYWPPSDTALVGISALQSRKNHEMGTSRIDAILMRWEILILFVPRSYLDNCCWDRANNSDNWAADISNSRRRFCILFPILLSASVTVCFDIASTHYEYIQLVEFSAPYTLVRTSPWVYKPVNTRNESI